MHTKSGAGLHIYCRCAMHNCASHSQVLEEGRGDGTVSHTCCIHKYHKDKNCILHTAYRVLHTAYYAAAVAAAATVLPFLTG
mgnify:CR=1 FL=1